MNYLQFMVAPAVLVGQVNSRHFECNAMQGVIGLLAHSVIFSSMLYFDPLMPGGDHHPIVTIGAAGYIGITDAIIGLLRPEGNQT